MGLMDVLRPAKKVPLTRWSADDPLSLKPRLQTIIILVFGLWVFGTGDAILIAAGIGNTPWTVLAEGIALNINWTVGQATFLVSALVLLLWIPLKEKPGLGTILNAIIIAAAIEIMVPRLPTPETQLLAISQVLLGVLLIGIGSGCLEFCTTHNDPGICFLDYVQQHVRILILGQS